MKSILSISIFLLFSLLLFSQNNSSLCFEDAKQIESKIFNKAQFTRHLGRNIPRFSEIKNLESSIIWIKITQAEDEKIQIESEGTKHNSIRVQIEKIMLDYIRKENIASIEKEVILPIHLRIIYDNNESTPVPKQLFKNYLQKYHNEDYVVTQTFCITQKRRTKHCQW